MGCSTSFAKCILIIFNTIILLLSVACLAVGVAVVVSANTFFSFVNKAIEQIDSSSGSIEEINSISQQTDIIRATAFVLIGLGAIVFLISILGCIGACKESKCLLVTYATFVGLLAAAKIALVVVGILQRPKLEEFASNSLKKVQDNFFISVNEITDVANSTAEEAMNTYPKELKTAVTLMINYMQVALSCCGANENKDIAQSPSWKASDLTWKNTEKMEVPVTCCPIKEEMKGQFYQLNKYSDVMKFLVDDNCPANSKGVHSKTCMSAFMEMINSYLYISIGAFGGLILVELLLVIFALCVACTSRDEKIRRGNY